MAKYKVLNGAHAQAQYGWEPSDEEKKDAESKGVTPRAPTEMFKIGDEFESDLDLVARFGPEKFQLLSGTPKDKKKFTPNPTFQIAPVNQLGEKSNVGSEQTEDEGDKTKPKQTVATPHTPAHKNPVDFDHMTIRQLQEYADEEEIDLKGAKTKDEMVRALKKK